jgi:amyloid beta precursor protein binding protein 1
MVSDSEKFVALQNVYKLHAQHDVESVMSRVERILLNINKPYDSINEQKIRVYCKNAHFLKSIRYRSLADEYDPQTSRLDNLLGMNFLKIWSNMRKKIKMKEFLNIKEDNQDSDLISYVLLRALESFIVEFNRYPGYNSEFIDTDINLFKKILTKFLNDHRINANIRDDFIQEM